MALVVAVWTLEAGEVILQRGQRQIAVGHPVVKAVHEFALAHSWESLELPVFRTGDTAVEVAVERRPSDCEGNNITPPLALKGDDRFPGPALVAEETPLQREGAK